MLFYFVSHRKIASQFFSVTNIEENHRCDATAIPGLRGGMNKYNESHNKTLTWLSVQTLNGLAR